jgi:MinD-like ATPase involved in chromosome partitioning or flagellar assembly
VTVPVLTAVSDAGWEADLVAALDGGDHGVTVVRRCLDLADLLATAATGQARAVLLSADLRRLDRDALTRLQVAGLVVVGLHLPGDERAERRLRQLGVAVVLPSDVTAREVGEAVASALRHAVTGPHPLPLGEPRRALPDLPDPVQLDLPELGAGQVVAVWGPTGAPGRTTVALTLAAEAAGLGTSALLVDADVYGGVVAQALGLLDEAPGLAAACRLANTGALDLVALAGLVRQLSPELRVLTGIARAERWPELRPDSLEVVLAQCRSLAALTVVDCGFAIEQDEELVYDTMAPRRNGATLTALARADVVLAIGTADPVGLQRLVRALADLRDALPGVRPRVVVNRLRPGAVPGAVEVEVTAALQRFAGVADPVLVPHDQAGCDRALATGRTLAEAAPTSPARMALRALAAELCGADLPRSRRGHRVGWRARATRT